MIVCIGLDEYGLGKQILHEREQYILHSFMRTLEA